MLCLTTNGKKGFRKIFTLNVKKSLDLNFNPILKKKKGGYITKDILMI